VKKFLGAVVIFGLVMAPAFAVQTGGAGALNPEVVKGAFTAEANASSQTLEVTSGITKLGTPTYTWPAALGPENSYLKDSGTGTLTWEVISGTSAAGETGQIQFNSSDNFAASENLSWDASGNNKLFVTGTVEATYFSGDGGQLSNVTPAGSAGGDLTGTYPDPSIAANAVTTAKISDEAVTGGKLANQIIKSGTLDDAAYSLILSNEGTGEDIGIGPLFSSYTRLQNSAGDLTLALVSQSVPEEGGIAGIVATKYLMMNSPGIQIETDELELRGTIYTKDLSPSLYVKTDDSSKLTAEALSLDGVSLDEGKILIGDGSNQASAQSVSGNITMTSTGVTTIAADAVTTAKISDEAVTSSKLANQILKSGTLDDAAYSLTFSNEGTGTDIGLPLPMSSYVLMRNSEGTFVMGQIPSQIPDVGGIGAVYSDKFLILASDNVVKLTAPELQFTIDAEGGNIRFVNDIDSELDVLTVDQGGVITAYSLPPSLYVKTTTDQKLTAEAIDISSGITGTLEIQYGGTGISSYPPSGEILIGDGTNYNLRIISGDVSMNYLGEVALRDGRISTSKLASNFILPINRGGTGITTTPMGPQILLGYMGSYSLRTVSGDVTMDYLGNYTIGSGKITADKLASNFTLPVDRGGTSVQSFTQHGIVYAATATSLDSTAAGSAGTVLKGTGSAPEFGQVVTAEIASGAVTTPKLAGNIDINTTGSISTGGSVNIGTTLEAGGRVIYTPSGTETITEGGGVTEDMLAKKVILIAGDGSGTTDISANPQIAAGSNGQMIILIGTNDSNLVKFDNGNGLQLSAATSFTLGIGDILQLVYVESLSKWVEISRTDN